MRRWAIIVLAVSAFTSVAWAVPATKSPIVRILSDGRLDTVYLHGDEFGSYHTDVHGRILAKEVRPLHAPQRQMLDTYMPSSGTVRVPVLLVNFSDYSFTIENPIAQFDDLYNGKGGSNPKATGSVHDYFMASSDSILDLQYDVFGVYTLSHEMEYYGGNKTNSSGVTNNHNIRASELVKEAAQLAADNGVDFSLYDNNNDGVVDNLSIVVAGYNEAEGGEERTIWPHYSVIQNSKSYNGKYLGGYLIISEYRSSGGKVQAGIGTYCHEFGHALGLPDLYDTDNSSRYTVGTWDIMCSGSYNNDGSSPPSFTAFERFMMGWLTPTQVTSGMQILSPIETDNQALLIAASEHNLKASDPNPSEYFLLENRQSVGWDAAKDALVADGLLVSHVTFDRTAWSRNTFNNSTPLGFAVVSAGASLPNKSSEADVFPGSTKRTSWIPELNNGAVLSNQNVSQIRQRNDGCISLQIGSDGRLPLAFDRDEVQIETSYLLDPVSYDTAHIRLLIDSVKTDRIMLTVSSRNFRISPDNGVNWYSSDDTASVVITSDSTYSLPILAIHTPSRKNCSYVYAFLTAETADGSVATQMTLAGRAPRPTYITTPVIDSVTNVTAQSFCLNWTPQEDAEGYYYTLYTLSEGESEESDSLNVLFNRSGQTEQTARTIYAPDKVSVWIDNTYTPNSVDSVIGGEVRIFGSADGTNWDKVTTILIQRTTKNVLRSIELDTTQHWRQFRLEYTHLGGYGGAVMKDWSSHFPMNINYLYRLEDNMLYASADNVLFRSLNPGTTYYYAMQAFEEKGCEIHKTDLSEPCAVTTKHAALDQQLIVKRDANGNYTVELPDMADGLHRLAIYDYYGHLVYYIVPAYGSITVSIPVLHEGQIYMLKYYQQKMGRKDLHGKFIYY